MNDINPIVLCGAIFLAVVVMILLVAPKAYRYARFYNTFGVEYTNDPMMLDGMTCDHVEPVLFDLGRKCNDALRDVEEVMNLVKKNKFAFPEDRKRKKEALKAYNQARRAFFNAYMLASEMGVKVKHYRDYIAYQ